MRPCPSATVTVAFAHSSRPRNVVAVPPNRVPRVARHLALAHEVDRRIRTGDLADLAHAARVFGLTRGRVTHLTNLMMLAPAIQADILAMPPVTVGRDRITERTLRPIVAEPMWGRQLGMWRGLGSRAQTAGERPPLSSNYPATPEPGRKPMK
jgi:hypothetical protein